MPTGRGLKVPSRYTLGTMKGIWAEPGTLLGPKDITKEWLVSVETNDEGTVLGYATNDEIMEAISRVMVGDVRSVAEYKMRKDLASAGA